LSLPFQKKNLHSYTYRPRSPQDASVFPAQVGRCALTPNLHSYTVCLRLNRDPHAAAAALLLGFTALSIATALAPPGAQELNRPEVLPVPQASGPTQAPLSTRQAK